MIEKIELLATQFNLYSNAVAFKTGAEAARFCRHLNVSRHVALLEENAHVTFIRKDHAGVCRQRKQDKTLYDQILPLWPHWMRVLEGICKNRRSRSSGHLRVSCRICLFSETTGFFLCPLSRLYLKLWHGLVPTKVCSDGLRCVLAIRAWCVWEFDGSPPN